MKNKGDRVVTLYSFILDPQVQDGRVWRIIKLIQAFMGVLVTCRNDEDPLKNESARVVTKDLPL